MSDLMMHKYFMLAALEQAWLGRGKSAPNPSVGAVMVHKGEIIAKAWHRGPGTPHAEQLLLEQIPAGLEELSLYVTLEPCNHWGKTPPCVTSIINSGVSQVVFGYQDPNPIVAANNTPKQLEEKGIEVLHYSLPEVDRFYQSYHYWTKTKRPWVTTKLAQSLDGKIGLEGERIHLSNEACAEFTHLNRSYSDVILTTAKTVLADNPQLNVRLNEEKHGKIIAILDSRLSLSKESQVFNTALHCHIYHLETSKVKTRSANCSYHAVPAASGKEDFLDLAYIINHLGSLGFHDIWVEAGGRLFSALHHEDLVQRAYLYLTPHILGSNAVPAFNSDFFFRSNLKPSWKIMANNVIACFDSQEDLCLLE